MRLRALAITVLLALLTPVAVACGGSSDFSPAGPAQTAVPGPTVAVAWDSSETLRIGTSADFPPSNFINERGEIDGFERDLGDELCRRMEVECTWVQNEWVSIIPNLLSDEYDAIIASMAATKERDELIDFSQAYLPNSPSAYVALAGSGDDAINGTIAVQVNTIQQDYLDDAGTARVIFLPGEDPVEAVRRGDADAVFADRIFLEHFVENSGGDLVFVGPEVSFDFQYAGVGVRENDTELKRRFNAAIGTMKDDGTLNDLIRKWFGEDAETF